MSDLLDKANTLMIPSGYKAGTLYNVLPNTAAGDFDVDRNSVSTRINSSKYIEDIGINVPRLEYKDSTCPVLTTYAPTTNLITYPISFGNSYWTKSGAVIEGDPSTAGSELVDDYNFSLTVNQGNNIIGTYWRTFSRESIVSNVFEYNGLGPGRLDSKSGVEINNGKIYEVNVSVLSGTCRMVVLNEALISIGDSFTNNEIGITTHYFVAENNATNIVISLQNVAGGTAANIDFISVKEVSGFSSPHIDYPTDAFKLVEDTSTGTHQINSNIGGLTSSEDYTFSINAKPSDRNLKTFSYDGANSTSTDFDLTNGTITSGVGEITQLVNGYYKCSITHTLDATKTGISIYYRLLNDSSYSYTGDGTSGVYIYGANLTETDVSYPFIYDGTEGSTTTCLGDVINGSEYTGSSESGVFYAEIATHSDKILDRFIAISDGTTSNRVIIGYSAAIGRIYSLGYVGGNVQWVINGAEYDCASNHKIAVRWAENDISLYIDGVEVDTDVASLEFTTNILNTITFSSGIGIGKFYGNTKQLGAYEYLTDAEMIELTT